MSNFICSECGMTNIDCGRAGYKTPKEIELEKRLEVSEKEHYRTLEQLRIATGALRETKDRLLKIELSNLNYEERHKLYDIMFADGVIDRALLEMDGVK